MCRRHFRICFVDFRISAKAAQVNEKDRVNQEELDAKCLQLLRGVIHNEIVKLPEDWEIDTKGNRKYVTSVSLIVQSDCC